MRHVLLLCLLLVWPLPASATWPNLGPNATEIHSFSFDTLPPADQSTSVDGWFLYSGRHSLIMAANEPESPSSSLRFTYEIGYPAGIGPGNFYRSLGGLNEVYFGYTWRPSNPWQNEAQSNVNKISFLVGGTNRNELILVMAGPGPTYRLRTYVQTLTRNNLGVNGGAAQNPLDGGQLFWFDRGAIVLGAWNRIEVYTKLSSCNTCPDGIVRTWLNGTLLVESTNIIWNSDNWDKFFISPTWGGANNTKTQVDTYDFGHVVTARPTGGTSGPIPPTVTRVVADVDGANVVISGPAAKLRYWDDFQTTRAELPDYPPGSPTYRLVKHWPAGTTFTCVQPQTEHGVWTEGYQCTGVTPAPPIPPVIPPKPSVFGNVTVAPLTLSFTYDVADCQNMNRRTTGKTKKTVTMTCVNDADLAKKKPKK